MAPKSRNNDEDSKSANFSRPTVADLQGEHPFAQLARQHWLKSSKKASKVKVKQDVIKEGIWDVLERESFQYRSLLVLESLQILESYLWPGYSEDSSNYHVLLIAFITNVRGQEHLPTWGKYPRSRS
jgi:intron-binding protein aquarius